MKMRMRAKMGSLCSKDTARWMWMVHGAWKFFVSFQGLRLKMGRDGVGWDELLKQTQLGNIETVIISPSSVLSRGFQSTIIIISSSGDTVCILRTFRGARWSQNRRTGDGIIVVVAVVRT
jgi:hypothetical protein